jgi:hypothetical protein
MAMAYRGDDGDALEAPTAEGALRLEVGPRLVRLAVGGRSLQLAGKFATVTHGTRRPHSYALGGQVFVARGVPREDLAVWLAEPGRTLAVRRIFAVAPVSLLDPAGLRAAARLDALAKRLRTALAGFDTDGERRFSARTVELGSGDDLDKVLLADHGDYYAVYARRLFRDRARLQIAIHKDGRIILGDAEPLTLPWPLAISVRGDHVRFADASGADVASIAVPWLAAGDREELARRLGQLVV